MKVYRPLKEYIRKKIIDTGEDWIQLDDGRRLYLDKTERKEQDEN